MKTATSDDGHNILFCPKRVSCINSFKLHGIYYLYFKDEETEAQQTLKKSSKFLHLRSGRAGSLCPEFTLLVTMLYCLPLLLL